jgi:hypothetical protein
MDCGFFRKGYLGGQVSGNFIPLYKTRSFKILHLFVEAENAMKINNPVIRVSPMAMNIFRIILNNLGRNAPHISIESVSSEKNAFVLVLKT